MDRSKTYFQVLENDWRLYVDYGGSNLISVSYTNSILCQTWVLESQLLGICSQGLGAYRTEISPHWVIVWHGDIIVTNVASTNNLVDPFTTAF